MMKKWIGALALLAALLLTTLAHAGKPGGQRPVTSDRAEAIFSPDIAAPQSPAKQDPYQDSAPTPRVVPAKCDLWVLVIGILPIVLLHCPKGSP
jgi:hypothetical protein